MCDCTLRLPNNFKPLIGTELFFVSNAGSRYVQHGTVRVVSVARKYVTLEYTSTIDIVTGAVRPSIVKTTFRFNPSRQATETNIRIDVGRVNGSFKVFRDQPEYDQFTNEENKRSVLARHLRQRSAIKALPLALVDQILEVLQIPKTEWELKK